MSTAGSWSSIYQFVRRYPVLPAIVLVGLAIMAIFAPILAPLDPLDSDLSKVKAPPAWIDGGTFQYFLGADGIGRDLLSRIIFGSRISMMVAGVVILTGGIVGVFLGLVAGYYGGVRDEVIMRLVDVFYAIPFILVALVVAVVFGSSLGLVMILLSLFSWPIFARQTRALTLQLKTKDYVAAAKIAGASPSRIALRHIVHGLMNVVIVIATLQVGNLILTESVLSFLGIGIPAPQPAWGSMIAEGRVFITSAWWIPLMPGAAVFLTVFAFNFLGDWLRDYYDPNLRQL
jgi:peptide/nickel transport system permease protein